MRKFTALDFEYLDFNEPDFDDTNHPGYGEYSNEAMLRVTVKDETGKIYHLDSPRVYTIVDTSDYHYYAQTYWEPEDEYWHEDGIHFDEDYIDEIFFSKGTDDNGIELAESDLPTVEESDDIVSQLEGGYIDYRKTHYKNRRSLA